VALGNITFRRIDPVTIEAEVASAWLPMDLDEARARGELEHAQQYVNELFSEDAAFRDAVGGSSIDVVLVHDYDTGSLSLCRMGPDGVEWLASRET
jgi:hypothetical protein